MDLLGVVLCGGASRRMGVDKATLVVEGTPLVHRVAGALSAGGLASVVAVGGDSEALERLGMEVIADEFPGQGPLGAIITALRVARARGADGAVVAACDLSDLDGPTIESLVDVATSAAADVVAARSRRLEPLCAVWMTSCLEPLESTFAAGERAVHDGWAGLSVVSVPVGERAVTNANTVDDLRSRVASHVMAVQEVTIDQLEDALASGARLIDVRNPDEYLDAHVPGAILVPLSTVPNNVDAFRNDSGTTYVICKAGGRSMSACAFLADHGVTAVNVAGGTAAWLESGRPYVTGNDPA